MKKYILFIVILSIVKVIYSQRVENIPFEQTQSGIMYVSVEINNYPLKFIFDTGASGLVINMATFAQMQQRNIINNSDIIGRTQVVIADGSTAFAMIVRLNSVKVGSFVINNVKAFVMPENTAPLLLGQNVFSKFGKITIDYNNKNIELTRNQNQQNNTTYLRELRFIPCSSSKVQDAVEIKNILNNSINITNISQETNIPPPANAVNRIKGNITIRYFDNKNYDTALLIKNKISNNPQFRGLNIHIENMLPFYNYKSIPNYIEIWIK